ncbi:DMT family transporter [Paenibacillus xanthanilyticus]|uniref:DMT family transporter n=1 Tax=Paenibacillus xanthanilyticus TaxID=1783531 RepID=A0ABV8K552_9BACL
MMRLNYTLLVLMTTFLMGIAFPIGKMGLDYAPPFLLMGVRYMLAGGMLAIGMVGRAPLPRGIEWLRVAAIGFLQTCAVMGCAYYSMHWISAAESSILTFTNPLFVIVLGTLLYGARYRPRQWFGVMVGFTGVAIAFGARLGFGPGTAVGLCGGLLFACSTLLIKRWGGRFNVYVLVAYQMLLGGIGLLLLSLFTERMTFALSGRSVAIVACLVVFCSILQLTLWFRLLQTGDPAKTSAFLFLVPLFGVLSSWLLLGEPLTWHAAVGGICTGAGIFLVNWEGTRRMEKSVAVT